MLQNILQKSIYFTLAEVLVLDGLFYYFCNQVKIYYMKTLLELTRRVEFKILTEAVCVSFVNARINLFPPSSMFGLVVFYGILTLVGYLMPNPLYTYILNIYDL